MKYSLERRVMKLPRERFQPIYSYSKKIQFNLNASPDTSFSRQEAFTSDVLKLHIILYQIDCTQHAQVVITGQLDGGSKSDINTFSTLMSNQSIVVQVTKNPQICTAGCVCSSHLNTIQNKRHIKMKLMLINKDLYETQLNEMYENI